jgi:hypothetical protein
VVFVKRAIHPALSFHIAWLEGLFSARATLAFSDATFEAKEGGLSTISSGSELEKRDLILMSHIL